MNAGKAIRILFAMLGLLIVLQAATLAVVAIPLLNSRETATYGPEPISVKVVNTVPVNGSVEISEPIGGLGVRVVNDLTDPVSVEVADDVLDVNVKNHRLEVDVDRFPEPLGVTIEQRRN